MDAVVGAEPLAAVLKSFKRPRNEVGPCPHCGCTQNQWKETGLVGCPLCYEVFRKDLSSHFGIHGSL